ncbi:MAG: 2,3,4,5-tetrahydropyridine-2,6-dicarboxylate N-succinyltransferase [Gemmatimonadetes bacterium]|nr:2,3,4,5-tetrahydropyridine-2,6-dicarboxylate N-succinyltransferase [Gemmatimonadota bacterium]
MTAAELRTIIEGLYELPAAELPADAVDAVRALRDMLSRGDVRAAEPAGAGWLVNDWVKKGILVGFRAGQIADYSINERFPFFDKDTFPPRAFGREDGVRIVPGGSSIRDGAFVAPGVVCMPPMFINVGSYVDEGTMIDSHALVGSCAQIGKHVHLSAGVQIGGVLEPIGAMPVIIEDGALIGGNCGVYEATIVGAGAVLAPGTMLTRSTPIYDLVNDTVVRSAPGEPMTVPPRAVVVPGSRPAKGKVAEAQGVHLYTPVIVKYRDPATDAAVALEDALR